MNLGKIRETQRSSVFNSFISIGGGIYFKQSNCCGSNHLEVISVTVNKHDSSQKKRIYLRRTNRFFNRYNFFLYRPWNVNNVILKHIELC